MNRITNTILENKVRYLNEITNNPVVSWIGGKAQVGNYHISGAYGGVSLHQMMNEHGGIKDIFQCGHTTLRDLFNRICAYIDGIHSTK